MLVCELLLLIETHDESILLMRLLNNMSSKWSQSPKSVPSVPMDQQCELNCRAVGFRFYVQQSEKVIDGTPCGQNDTSLCVLGKCSVGHLFLSFFTF